MAIEIDYKTIVDGRDKFGGDVQALKAVEELSELSQILIKQHIHPEEDLREKILEEVADVFVCLENIRQEYLLYDDDINRIIKLKQQRFRKKHLKACEL